MSEEQDIRKLSKSERRRLKKLRKKRRDESLRSSGPISKNIAVIGVLGVMIIAAGVYLFMLMGSGPGAYDGFAKCLSSTGAVVYGNDYCSYTQEQLLAFGKSSEYLNYVRCIENEELCDQKGVQTTPTWEINGAAYSGTQSFEKLSELSGCEI